MKDDLLSEVVEVERELARNLETEDIKAKEMLDNLRRSSEQKISEEEKRLQEALDQALTASVIRTDKKASDIIEKADATASRLERISDEVLKEIIKKHIARILP
jgi:predicted DNA-binding protein